MQHEPLMTLFTGTSTAAAGKMIVEQPVTSQTTGLSRESTLGQVGAPRASAESSAGGLTARRSGSCTAWRPGLSIKKYFKTYAPWRACKGPPQPKHVISLVELPTGDSIRTTLYLAPQCGQPKLESNCGIGGH